MSDKMILRVLDLSRGGAGVCRESDGRVIFVPYTAPGDLVRVRIQDSSRNYAHAELIEILEPSPHRQSPRCPVFGRCGGCDWQHLPYQLQWETKVKGILHVLARAGLTLLEDIFLIPAEKPWEYRNRVQLRGQGNQLGFFRSGTREFISADRCDIARSEINQKWEEIRTEGNRGEKPYNVEVEILPEGEVKKTWNSPHAARGFRQVNDEQNEKLKNWIASQVEGSEILFDLFGGFGNLSVQLIKKMKEIHCVDLSVPQLKSQLTPHYYFHQSGILPWLKERITLNRKYSSMKDQYNQGTAIIDPPRKGLNKDFFEIASALEALYVRELVVVGCDSDSWVRDLSQWKKRGWALRRIMAIDLFPQTHHIELVGVLIH